MSYVFYTLEEYTTLLS